MVYAVTWSCDSVAAHKPQLQVVRDDVWVPLYGCVVPGPSILDGDRPKACVFEHTL